MTVRLELNLITTSHFHRDISTVKETIIKWFLKFLNENQIVIGISIIFLFPLLVEELIANPDKELFNNAIFLIFLCALEFFSIIIHIIVYFVDLKYKTISITID